MSNQNSNGNPIPKYPFIIENIVTVRTHSQRLLLLNHFSLFLFITFSLHSKQRLTYDRLPIQIQTGARSESGNSNVHYNVESFFGIV